MAQTHVPQKRQLHTNYSTKSWSKDDRLINREGMKEAGNLF